MRARTRRGIAFDVLARMTTFPPDGSGAEVASLMRILVALVGLLLTGCLTYGRAAQPRSRPTTSTDGDVERQSLPVAPDSNAVDGLRCGDISPTEDPRYNAALNPTYNSTINPAYNVQINPTYNVSINPTYTVAINPTYNASINPKYNAQINPTYNASINPNYNASINPKYMQPRRGVDFRLFSRKGDVIGCLVATPNGAFNLFSADGLWIGYLASNSIGGFNLFSIEDASWVGYFAGNSESGLNQFDSDGEWLAFAARER